MTTNTEALLREAAQKALNALEEIALAGMSGSGQESEDGMRDWHARQAWKFIGIAARALDPIRQALATQPEQAKGGEDVAGELDPRRSYEFGQLITKYSESFNGQNWGSVCDSVDRKNLAVALDHLTEAGAMLMNISERLLRTHPAHAASAEHEARVIEQNARKAAQEQLYAERDRHTAEVKRLQAEIGRLKAPAASVSVSVSVSDEQIAAFVKRASTYGVPFVGLLNPGGTPSDFSKRFTAEILAMRPAQAGDQWREAVEEMFAVNHITMPEDPREAIKKLIATEVRDALDPTISSAAAALDQAGVPDDIVKDAERYRWLRDNGGDWAVCSWGEDDGGAWFRDSRPPTVVDRAIDAAMRAAAPTKKDGAA